MRVEYDPKKAKTIIVSEGSESITSGPCEVFGCVVPEEEWDEHSAKIGRAMVDARDEYEVTISKIGAFSSHQALHPNCLREGNLVYIGAAENLSVKYPFRLGDISIRGNMSSMGPKKVRVNLDIQPSFGGSTKQLEYVYLARHENQPGLSDQVMEMSLFNPDCKEENQVNELDERSVALYEDTQILFAFNRREDIVATTV